jgi:hypothetical protein
MKRNLPVSALICKELGNHQSYLQNKEKSGKKLKSTVLRYIREIRSQGKYNLETRKDLSSQRISAHLEQNPLEP